MATLHCTFAFIDESSDQKAAKLLEIIEQTNADLQTQQKNSSLIVTQDASTLALHVTITAQAQHEALALQEELIAAFKAWLADAGPIPHKSPPVKSMILKLFKDNPARDYTAREVANALGKKPHNISAVMQLMVQEGDLKATQQRPKGRFGKAPMAYALA